MPCKSITISSAIPDNGGPTALVKTGPGIADALGPDELYGQHVLERGDARLRSRRRTPPIAGIIHGLGNLTKSGTATLTLTGTSDYSGSTTITGGELCVNGALGRPSTVALQSGDSLRQRHDRRQRDRDGRGDWAVILRDYLGFGQCNRRHPAHRTSRGGKLPLHRWRIEHHRRGGPRGQPQHVGHDYRLRQRFQQCVEYVFRHNFGRLRPCSRSTPRPGR